MSFKSRELRGMFSALAMLCASLMLAACAAASYAGIPLAAGAEDPELQALARRAESGDRQAQLELGIRYEEGRGVPPDRERARRLYQLSLGGSRFQVQFVPSGTGVAPENTATGTPPLWPRSAADIAGYHPSRIEALLRLCSLQPAAGDADCDPTGLEVLGELARLEVNFRTCRLRANLGNAGPDPYSFIFNSEDTLRLIQTRRCMFEGPVETLAAERSRLVWAMWLGLKQLRGCGTAGECEVGDVWALFDSAAAEPLDDSLIQAAMRAAIDVSLPPEPQVGSSWWFRICGLLSAAPHTATAAEQQTCRVIEVLNRHATR